MHLFPDLRRTVALEIALSIRSAFTLRGSRDSYPAWIGQEPIQAYGSRARKPPSFRRAFALALSRQSASIRKEVHARSAGVPSAAVLPPARRVGDVLRGRLGVARRATARTRAGGRERVERGVRRPAEAGRVEPARWRSATRERTQARVRGQISPEAPQDVTHAPGASQHASLQLRTGISY